MKKVPESHFKIRFQDCDPFNHLNNANYINYMINAREDHVLEHYDIDIYKMGRIEGKSWVTGMNQIAYLKPAFPMETVTIDSQLLQYSNTSLLIEIKMWNADKSELKAILWVTFIHFDLKTQKRTEHSQALLHLFEQVVVPIKTHSFENRVQQFTPTKTS